ncbi:MAG: DUF3147 family protein [Actinomycetota bacterium]|nr:DUF3147 family protein [Actinomycetota bacterium]
MNAVALTALHGVVGGTLVVVFALIGQVVKPRAFSGLFMAAPSVAIASLAITVGFEGAMRAEQDAIGMVPGALGMVACCLVATGVIPKIRALWGSLAAWAAWGVVGLGLYWAVFVGAR